MYSKTLVPLDGSQLAEQILPYARLIAAAHEIPVELFWVNDIEVASWPLRSGREYLRQAAAKYFAASAQINSIEADGKPAEMIVRRAESEPECVIAMATHGVSDIRRWVLGSVAEKVIQHSRAAVLLVRAG